MGSEVKKEVGLPPRPPRSAAAKLRWRLLSRAIVPSHQGTAIDGELKRVSRRPGGRYNLVPCRIVTSQAKSGAPEEESLIASRLNGKDVLLEYTIPVATSMKLKVRQKHHMDLQDFARCQKNAIDNTGIICLWPAEEVLTYFCAGHPEIFRQKTVIELGAGYGLGGLAIAACTDAAEVVITDGNPEVVDYIEQNVQTNRSAFGNTAVSSSTLYWSRDQVPLSGRTFDLVVAADCTFFKDFHFDLAYTIKSLLGISKDSQAILFNPRRGNTLDMFVEAAESLALNVEIKEQYDEHLWSVHQHLLKGDRKGWPNYDSNHCYPLFLSVTSRETV
ncbi:calmodulin-lysine N-methyltransferase [Marchantia polymorpha subsp. ruderalis]|uniref:Calmodulin-lysine N-methyltransferase n=2 Tax=Marchantia polymorpha TaxID=3197 RepID=A0AAF6B6L8_MARPO|nr:hypothetical protein MARPO_0087s0053 [Marchantia polymorpha]BBN07652.1 hypothetical protein Mp_4g05360 [Marchantia polymorpha subsp. ruderalis]|eukprot:PTQ33619.1 hypothetical protein MARPO_0087s0053 [Marchantia polymorpha]